MKPEEKLPALTKELATEEVQKWLDHKKVSESKRAASAGSVEALIEAFMSGVLILNTDFTITHKLNFPIKDKDEKIALAEIIYKPRVKMETIHSHFQGVKAADADGRVAAMCAAVSGQNKALILKQDTEDYSIGQAIVVFFL